MKRFKLICIGERNVYTNKRMKRILPKTNKTRMFINRFPQPRSLQQFAQATFITTNALFQFLKIKKPIPKHNKMLKRPTLRSSIMKRTVREPVELHRGSIHIVCKKLNGEIIIEKKFWAKVLSSGEYYAYSIQQFDSSTQKIILSEIWNKRNIDFPLTSITRDVEVLNKIRECGFYYEPPTENWELNDQESSTIQEPSFCYQINSEE